MQCRGIKSRRKVLKTATPPPLPRPPVRVFASRGSRFRRARTHAVPAYTYAQYIMLPRSSARGERTARACTRCGTAPDYPPKKGVMKNVFSEGVLGKTPPGYRPLAAAAAAAAARMIDGHHARGFSPAVHSPRRTRAPAHAQRSIPRLCAYWAVPSRAGRALLYLSGF